ncbi:unnamed protein product [Paramecium sonneborni]|uniref:Transmembrane protein n=1 Tax=Paramecium sonneborni TaxID=65129 RepID=A0A8S1N3L3_9CILI|nr:unnamed protein product [Paramecium sonneborni]
MITNQMLNINQKVILKRIEILTMLEFTVNWILFIIQEYLMHSWFFFITVQQYIKHHRFLLISFQILSKFTLLVTQNNLYLTIFHQCKYYCQNNRCLPFLVILLIIMTFIYGINIQLFLLLFQILFQCLKIKLRSFLLIGHQDRQQHIQLETLHAQ